MSKTSQKWEEALEIAGCLRIASSFWAIGLGTGCALYYLIGKSIGILSGLIFFLAGIYIATRAYKGKGTLHILSRTMASPELDQKTQEVLMSELFELLDQAQKLSLSNNTGAPTYKFDSAEAFHAALCQQIAALKAGDTAPLHQLNIWFAPTGEWDDQIGAVGAALANKITALLDQIRHQAE